MTFLVSSSLLKVIPHSCFIVYGKKSEGIGGIKLMGQQFEEAGHHSVHGHYVLVC